MHPWKTLRRETVLQHSKYLTVENHTVQTPRGQIIADWSWTIAPDYVNVVAVTADGRYLCFREMKYGIADLALSIVGGYLEPGEEPAAAARRELREETGHEADDWTPLGAYRVDANHTACTAHFFLARGTRGVAARNSGDLEEQELLLLTRAEVRRALLAGEFKCLAWTGALALALLRD